MLIACWSPKGGSGTTVVSCGLAIVLARSQPAGGGGSGNVVVADLAGDVPAVMGVPEPASLGITDWLAAGADVPPEALARLCVDVFPGLKLLPWSGAQSTNPAAGSVTGGSVTGGSVSGGAGSGGGGRGEALAAALAAQEGSVVADCGSASAGAGLAVAAAAGVSLMVVRPCYLALRRALSAPIRPTGVVLVTEPGRTLGRRDVEHVLGVPVRAEVEYDAAVARAVDAGLLVRRVPRGLQRALERAA